MNKLTVGVTVATFVTGLLFARSVNAQDTAGMGQEQAREREELGKMHDEVNDIKGNIKNSIDQMNEMNNQARDQAQASGANAHEYHLFAKQNGWELAPGITADAMTYNGKIPGPPLRVRQGENVKIVLHNQLKVPTSLIFQGLIAPQNVNGLPKQDTGIVKPGQAYVYQFTARQAGTYWYHPQVINQDQKVRGMYGALIIEPRSGQTVDKDVVMLLSEVDLSEKVKVGAESNAYQTVAPPGRSVKHMYLLNGKSAPGIPPFELRQGERVHLRVISAAQHVIPLYLSGHRFEVTGINGSDSLEPRVYRDTVAVNPGDRIDLEFMADNPGVWSLSSEIMEQATTEGRFPGGIACVVKYSGMQASE